MRDVCPNRKAASSYPRSAVALLYLARMSMDAGDLEKAGEHLKTAVARDPESAIAHRELGVYYLTRAQRSHRLPAGEIESNADLVEADRYLARSMSLDSRDRSSTGYRACALAELGATAEAERLRAAAGPGAWQSCDGFSRPK